MKKIIIFLAVGVLVAAALGGYYYLDRLPEKEIKDPFLEKVKKEGKIIVGTDATYPPMESIDESGGLVGMDIDIAWEVASDLGVKAEFQNISWEELFSALYKGKVDMLISSITITQERAQTMSFSDPYFNAGQVIVVKTGKAETIKKIEDLETKTVGVQVGTTSEQEARKYTELVRALENYDLVLEELLSDSIDAIVIDYPAGIGMITGNKDLVIAVGPFTQEFYGIAVKKGERVLLGEINQTLRRLKKEGKLKDLEQKWLIK